VSRRDRQSPTDAARQVAVVALRFGDEPEVCLIRRRDSGKWGIPKGFIDRGDTPEQAALTEALEEAGLQGRIMSHDVGVYRYEKWGARLTVAVYLMEVLEQHRDWLEKPIRDRRWCSLKKAGRLLDKHPVRPLWDRICARLVRRVKRRRRST
jgi:8-oxo-dGTP pyrophosphatase MutT (NUDIX family)